MDFEKLSESFEEMRIEKEIPQEAFISPGYWPHDEIINWAKEKLEAENKILWGILEDIRSGNHDRYNIMGIVINALDDRKLDRSNTASLSEG